MEIEDFRKHAHEAADWVADYLSSVEQYPVRSQVKPGDILAQLPKSCPEGGQSMKSIFKDFQDIILPGVTHWQHPSFFAYFNANASPPSIIAEILTAGLATQCMLWETTPSATELEFRMMEWLRDLIGLPQSFTGSIQDSGSGSNLCAILAGCNHAVGGKLASNGIAALCAPLVIYTSVEAHSSVEKAARIAGIGSDNVRKIPTRDDLGMDVDELRATISRDREAGIIPACIVGCFGGTGLGSIDPIREIGRLANSEDIHFHIDGAWAGSALLLPEVRPLADGIELADSFVFNPHKWLFTNFDCSAFFMRDPNRLVDALSLTPTYLETLETGEIPEYRDWSVALARRFRALKLWFVLRSYGAAELREKLRSHIAWTNDLAKVINNTDNFELTTEPRLAMLSFRYTGQSESNHTSKTLDELNDRLLGQVNNSGLLYLTKTRLNGEIVIRFMIGQTYTTWRHVEDGWNAIKKIADSL